MYALVAGEVGELMNCQYVCTYLGEGPEAARELATVWLQPVVHSGVFLQGRKLGKGLLTQRTDKILLVKLF